ncbi:E3 SUMO-protein ligase NSE2-like [Cylas formicarius]|uniref:E3 SUMO-protein ligase NSE2-like n=1 Tax=Cylas formicarius TaxID=197179 RepID=UPI0029589C35|nr:E3 SUMO-protein ligase NSE2-like [Cylas formicarius]
MALNERYYALLGKCVGSLNTWKKCVSRLEGIEKNEEMQKLEKLGKEYCVIDNNHKKIENVFKDLEGCINEPGQDYDIDAMFESKLGEQPDIEIRDNEIWGEIFKNRASVQEIKPKKKVDKANYKQVQDDSLLCSDAFSAPIDPISKIIIKKPVRNQICKHIYDMTSILQYIRQSRNKAKCPYIGCNNNTLTNRDLINDTELEEKISQYLSSQEQQEDSDTSE